MRTAHARSRLVAGALAVVATLLALSGCVTPAVLPPPPWKDADNGAPSDHGWFEGGQVWHGDFGDPDVVRVGGVYYAYSSPAAGRVLPVLTSTDLRTWYVHPRWSRSGPPGTPGYDVSTDPAIPAEIRASSQTAWDRYDNNDALVRFPSWGLPQPQSAWVRQTYWAPGVVPVTVAGRTTWYAYSPVRVSTASDDPHGYGRFCLTVSAAPGPLGPFRDVSGRGPVQCQPVASDPAGSSDPAPYRDPLTGRLYLLFKAAGKVGVGPSRIMSVELGPDGRPTPGAVPTPLLATNSQAPWEGSTIENPSMARYGGRTYLFYSASYFGPLDAQGHSSYATGYAVCRGPLGPCTRPVPGHPLLASAGVSQGPGGASAFLATDGSLRLAYATYWLGEDRGGFHPRRLQVTRLLADARGLLRVG